MGSSYVNIKQRRKRIYAKKIRWILLNNEQGRTKIIITGSNKKINNWNLFLPNEKKYTWLKTLGVSINGRYWVRRFNNSRFFGIEHN